MKVEYLIAYDDHWWDTITVDVPLETNDRETLVQWAEQNLAGQGRFRNVVMFGLYYLPDE